MKANYEIKQVDGQYIIVAPNGKQYKLPEFLPQTKADAEAFIQIVLSEE